MVSNFGLRQVAAIQITVMTTPLKTYLTYKQVSKDTKLRLHIGTKSGENSFTALKVCKVKDNQVTYFSRFIPIVRSDLLTNLVPLIYTPIRASDLCFTLI